MLLPPVDVESINIASFTPSELTAHRFSGGPGLIIHSRQGTIALVREEDGSTRLLPGKLAEKEYTVSETGETDSDALLQMLQIDRDTNLDPEAVLPLAASLLEGYRWRSTDELKHDAMDRETFLIRALNAPDAFLTSVSEHDKHEEEKAEDEKHEAEKIEDKIEDIVESTPIDETTTITNTSTDVVL